jgi:hypothetical protein
MGYAVSVKSRSKDGKPTGWKARGPLEALGLRPLVNGQVVKRPRGRAFPKFAGLEPSNHQAGATHHIDVVRARNAGILQDCTRPVSREEQQ